MAGRTQNKDLDRFLDASNLLKFNITKQRVVTLVNKDFEEDDFDEPKSYSSWHRALSGKPTWRGLVTALENLMEQQRRDPVSFLPGPWTDLRSWMREIAPAPWWFRTLDPSLTQASFNSWMAGRSINNSKLIEIEQKVSCWYGRLRAAAEDSSMRTRWAKILSHDNDAVFAKEEYEDVERKLCNRRGLSTFLYSNIVENGMSLEDALALMHRSTYRSVLGVIDMKDPKPCSEVVVPDDPRELEFVRARFDEILASDFKYAAPSTPPRAVWVYYKDFKRPWGGEECEETRKVLNSELHHKWHHLRKTFRWSVADRGYIGTDEIIEVSDDGKHWRLPSPREKRGWDCGMQYFLEELWHERRRHEGKV